MSIQTELTRLTNAKAAIQAAIEGKGVTVPSDTLLDGMAALIDAIEAGGGGSIAESGEWACGTYTPSEDIKVFQNPITIDTGLSSVRFFAFIFNPCVSAGVAYEMMMAVWDYNDGDYYGYRLAHSSSGSGINDINAGMTINNQYVGNTMYSEGGIMHIKGVTNSSKVAAGNTYRWFAISNIEAV